MDVRFVREWPICMGGSPRSCTKTWSRSKLRTTYEKCCKNSTHLVGGLKFFNTQAQHRTGLPAGCQNLWFWQCPASWLPKVLSLTLTGEQIANHPFHWQSRLRLYRLLLTTKDRQSATLFATYHVHQLLYICIPTAPRVLRNAIDRGPTTLPILACGLPDTSCFIVLYDEGHVLWARAFWSRRLGHGESPFWLLWCFRPRPEFFSGKARRRWTDWN